MPRSLRKTNRAEMLTRLECSDLRFEKLGGRKHIRKILRTSKHRDTKTELPNTLIEFKYFNFRLKDLASGKEIWKSGVMTE